MQCSVELEKQMQFCVFTYLFIFGCAGSFLLQGFFSRCSEQGPF